MLSRNNTVTDVPAYIAGFPAGTRKLLKQLRDTIRKSVPGAEELISYGMPAYKYHGVLVYFAAYKQHIGFYPTASGIRQFQKEITAYKNSKGTIQFPLDQVLPLSLITKIVIFRAKENISKEEMRKKKKTSGK